MVRAVEGTYRAGKVELNEAPAGVDGSRVVVLFLSDNLSDAAALPLPDREQAIRDLMAQMKSSTARLGGKPYNDRDEIYDRDNRR
jgi:hypothetical protein